MAKRITDNQLIGELGEAAVRKRFLSIGFQFDQRSRLEAGIDGLAEIMIDGQPTARMIAVQVKSTREKPYASETDTGFTYLLKSRDLQYWSTSNLPVIVVLYRQSDDSLYWSPVQTLPAGEQRRLVFDKTKDVLDHSCITSLAALTVPKNGVGYHVPPLVQDARMPTTSGDKLFGRRAELELIDRTWSDGKVNILIFVAMGGTGKTALVNQWLNNMQYDDWRGAERVYTWSFYSQGMTEDRQASADPFFDHALRWFGYEGDPINSAWERGLKLAELVAASRTLLILDGLEPLQYPRGEMQGRLKDQGLQALLRQLSRINRGLCLITTRSAVAELAGHRRDSVASFDLVDLQIEDGVALLRHLGVTSPETELGDAVRDFGNHALALSLLGSYIVAAHGGDIINRFAEPNLQRNVPGLGGHAERVMASYERWLEEHNKAELSILYLMGLFDRPAPAGAIDALRKEPPIPQLTDLLSNIKQSEWRFAFQNLRDLHLLNPVDKFDEGSLDAHPLVREYFGRRLNIHSPELWRTAHERLYEFYKSLPEKYLPDTRGEMEPLLSAIHHGCKAGMLQATFDDVYWPRVKRKDLHYNLHDLSMFGDDLGVIQNYFDNPWTIISASLRRYNQAEVANWAGYCFQALGSLEESAPLMDLSYKLFLSESHEWEAALVASVLSGIYLALGDIDRAVDRAQKAMGHADTIEKDVDRPDRNYSVSTFPTILADAFHQSGDLTKSENEFRYAVRIRKNESEYPLCSLSGFRYWEFCLSTGDVELAFSEASMVLEKSESLELSVLGIALCNLIIGNAFHHDIERKLTFNAVEPMLYINEACSLLRRSAVLDHLPRGYLLRSKLLTDGGQYDDAYRDLLEAFDVAHRGKMLLHLTDCHLASARLALALGGSKEAIVLNGMDDRPPATAEDHIGVASSLIQKTGYDRRRPDLALVRARLFIAKGEWDEAQRQICTAKRYVNEGWKIHEIELGVLTAMIQKG